jgi:hypothetical protein
VYFTAVEKRANVLSPKFEQLKMQSEAEAKGMKHVKLFSNEETESL